MKKVVVIVIATLMVFCLNGCKGIVDRAFDKFDDELDNMIEKYEEIYGSPVEIIE